MGLFEKSRLFRIAPSLGGAETLVSYPPAMSHVALSDAQLAEAGISKSLLRISTGIEDTEDLLEDLDASLKAL